MFGTLSGALTTEPPSLCHQKWRLVSFSGSLFQLPRSWFFHFAFSLPPPTPSFHFNPASCFEFLRNKNVQFYLCLGTPKDFCLVKFYEPQYAAAAPVAKLQILIPVWVAEEQQWLLTTSVDVDVGVGVVAELTFRAFWVDCDVINSMLINYLIVFHATGVGNVIHMWTTHLDWKRFISRST